MPTYDFECLECGFNFEDFVPLVDKESMKCLNCEGDTKTLITQHGFVFYEQYDETLQTYLTGPAQRRRIMKERGIEEVHKAEVNRLDKTVSKKNKDTVFDAALRARSKNAIILQSGGE